MKEMTPTLLVVDDEIQNIELAEVILKKEGYELHFALDATTAYKQLKEHKIDVIVLDLMMPDIDGFEVLETIKNDATLSHINIIVVSALSDEDSIHRALELGADGYIAKPYDIISLKSKVKEMLRASQSQHINLDEMLEQFFTKVSQEMSTEIMRKLFSELLIVSDDVELSIVLNYIQEFSQKELSSQSFVLAKEGEQRVVQMHVNRLLLRIFSEYIYVNIETVLEYESCYF